MFTCRERNNFLPLSVAQDPELWQLHLVANPHARQPRLPLVSYVFHRVSDYPGHQNNKSCHLLARVTSKHNTNLPER